MFKDATVDKAVTVFYLLEARSKAYMSAYPFTFESNVLEVRKSDTNATAIYLFLLACASFRYVASKRAQTQLATDYSRLKL